MTARRIGGTWYADFRFQHADGRVERVRRRSPVQSKAGAQEYERQLRAAMLEGRGPGREVPTFAAFAEEWMDTRVLTSCKPSEYATRRSILDLHLTPHLGALRLDRVDVRALERLKATLATATEERKALGAKSIRNVLAVATGLLRYAVDAGILDAVPKVAWPKAAEPDFDYLDAGEGARLIAGARPEWRAMIFVALRTGLRKGELLALQWGDVDLVTRRLNVQRSDWEGQVGTPKSGHGRIVPLSPEAVAVLKAHRHLKGELVFCTEDGSALTRHECRRPLWYACKRAGLRQVGWHVLRHSFASQLVAAGVSLKAVQELLGHSTIAVTMRYAHVAPAAKVDAVALLDGPHLGIEKTAEREEGETATGFGWRLRDLNPPRGDR